MATEVLFVDDEANVLSGLRRMLRGQRNVWNMHFAGGGADALAVMERETIDVIVSDMRMPGMDGAELLNQISQSYPHTVRLVLSGQSEHERILRAIGPAHQFMSKPCEPDVLVHTIERACGLQSQLKDESLKNLISRIGSLPSLPELYHQLVHELESGDASIDRVGEIIGSDLAMSAKVLQLVNSSFFGIPQHVSCPKHAVSLLGLGVIRPLTLTAGAFAEYECADLVGFSLTQAIDHGLAVATAARQIATAEAPQDDYLIDDAFIAGMMHDIGKLVLATGLTDTYADVLQKSRAEGIPLWQAELDTFGTSHADVGAYLLDLWGLPHSIVEAVAFHHRPSEAISGTFSPLTAVHAANVLRHGEFPGDDAASEMAWDQDYLQSLNMADHIQDWTQQIAQETDQ